jgi:hypothetical protein
MDYNIKDGECKVIVETGISHTGDLYKTDSSITLRQTLGWLGVLLPPLDLLFGVVFGNVLFQFNPAGMLTFVSISATHFANSYLLFEGTMMAVGLFLITYRGYDNRDFWITTVGGIGGIVLAMLPTKLADGLVANDIEQYRNFLGMSSGITTYFHMAGALVFFVAMAFTEIWQFTKTSLPENELPKKKRQRNFLYRFCGIAMLASILLGGAWDFFFHDVWPYGIYAGEWGGLWFFGIGWLVKGEVIRYFNDM